MKFDSRTFRLVLKLVPQLSIYKFDVQTPVPFEKLISVSICVSYKNQTINQLIKINQSVLHAQSSDKICNLLLFQCFKSMIYVI